MPRTDGAFVCPNCEIEIDGRPTYHVGLAFCCAGCVASGPCVCTYEDDRQEPLRVHECLDVTAVTDVPLARDLPLPRPEPALTRR